MGLSHKKLVAATLQEVVWTYRLRLTLIHFCTTNMQCAVQNTPVVHLYTAKARPLCNATRSH